jgi:transmembrane sensor
MSDMKSNKQMDRLLSEQSSEWIERLKGGKPEDHSEFAGWTMESRRHVRQFLMMAALDKELERFDPERKLAVPDVRHQGAEVVPLNARAEGSATALPEEASNAPTVGDARSAAVSRQTTFGTSAVPGVPTSRRATQSLWWSFAAMLVVFIGVAVTVYLLPRNGGWQELSTAVGEQRSVELLDGSVVHLNTGTRVAVRLSETTRDIRLLEGEALFKVYHDPSRPFRVHTFGAVIQAIGTQFNVYRRADGATVSVVEGRVQISTGDDGAAGTNRSPQSPGGLEGNTNAQPNETAASSGTAAGATGDSSGTNGSAGTAAVGGRAAEAGVPAGVTRLAAGEEARIDGKGRIEAQRDADVSRSTAWRERRLIFKQDSLGKIVTEFNRYNRVPQFKLIGTSVATRRYSGAFSVDDPESLSSLLASEPDLFVQRSGDEILVRARLETGSFANSP